MTNNKAIMTRGIFIALLFLSACTTAPDLTINHLQHTQIQKWKTAIARANGQYPHFSSIEEVNDYVNKFPYIMDQKNYGLADYWAAPQEFFAHNGGDCEDYAIAKYYLILQSGLAKADDMQIVMAYDAHYRAPHVLLAVGDKILNSQTNRIYNVGSPNLGQFSYIAVVNTNIAPASP